MLVYFALAGLGEMVNDSLDMMFDTTAYGEYKSFSGTQLERSRPRQDQEDEEEVEQEDEEVEQEEDEDEEGDGGSSRCEIKTSNSHSGRLIDGFIESSFSRL